MLRNPELLVEEGLHAGMSAALANGSSFVGSDLDSTVVISDQALLPSHFEVVFENGRTALRAAAGEIVLSDGTWLAPGENVICSSPCSFVAGSTRFELRVPATVAAQAAPASRTVTSVLSGLAAVAIAGVLAFTVMGLRPGRASPSVGMSRAAQMVNDAGPTRKPVEAVTAELRSRLNSAGLDTLAITPVRDGSVVVQGALFPTQMAAWASLREWYDTEYGASRVLVDRVVSTGSAPKLAISAVWAGTSPYVVNDHGDKLFVGSGIGGGWNIDAIEPGHVIAHNGTQKIAIRY